MIDSVLPITPAASANASRAPRSGNQTDGAFAQVLAKSSPPAEAKAPAAPAKMAKDPTAAKEVGDDKSRADGDHSESDSDTSATPAPIDLAALMPFIAPLPKNIGNASEPQGDASAAAQGLSGITALPNISAAATAQQADALPSTAATAATLTAATMATSLAAKNADALKASKATNAGEGAFAIAGDGKRHGEERDESNALAAAGLPVEAAAGGKRASAASGPADIANLPMTTDDNRRQPDSTSPTLNAGANDALAAGAAFNATHAAGSINGGAISHASTLLLATHVDAPSWSKDFGQHVIRLATEGQPTAEIHLNPPELGPIRVSIDMKGSEATVQFAAAHAETRGALEQALPMLRDMFASNDIALAGSSVSSQAFSGHPSHSQGQPASPGQPARSLNLRAGDDAAPSETVLRPIADRSRVDLFA